MDIQKFRKFLEVYTPSPAMKQRYFQDERRLQRFFEVVSCTNATIDFNRFVIMSALTHKNTPNNPMTACGCLRISLIFKVYDSGPKGYLDHRDLASMLEDIELVVAELQRRHPRPQQELWDQASAILEAHREKAYDILQFYESVADQEIQGTTYLMRFLLPSIDRRKLTKSELGKSTKSEKSTTGPPREQMPATPALPPPMVVPAGAVSPAFPPGHPPVPPPHAHVRPGPQIVHYPGMPPMHPGGEEEDDDGLNIGGRAVALWQNVKDGIGLGDSDDEGGQPQPMLAHAPGHPAYPYAPPGHPQMVMIGHPPPPPGVALAPGQHPPQRHTVFMHAPHPRPPMVTAPPHAHGMQVQIQQPLPSVAAQPRQSYAVPAGTPQPQPAPLNQSQGNEALGKSWTSVQVPVREAPEGVKNWMVARAMMMAPGSQGDAALQDAYRQRQAGQPGQQVPSIPTPELESPLRSE
uniref:EF-hand domain-containing protein n=1 Tax=Chromera velia CCMP2878 TaxID=1169474 RepID=A0A0G4FET0_9ALVE|eukprot:Cvel_3269.t1-p1 / transcript=Cvel_3269.t1 / gene=Cvel_3269 / organism=Chromera_velia_CCMP2878 / gene_product=hypothetical protein / transcript_product=hypothetical protein / location=Cvel_scaffold128:69316-72889(-) / protein_length=463 / sequence_SO=supercontig / SO=protein_coding / is_pseudo=false